MNNSFKMGTISSPCVSMCTLDHKDVCIGCYRTAREITEWLLMDDGERLDVLERCAERSRINNPFVK